MAVYDESVINTIRGKNIVGHANKMDIDILFKSLDAMEELLDKADEEDFFGTEGWRIYID